MSNLLKSRNIVCDTTEKKMIDYNQIISEKIQKIQQEIIKEHNVVNESEFVNGIDAASVERLLDEEEPQINEEEIKAKAESIIELANVDAKAIIERAKQESDLIRMDSATAGKAQGYEEGKKQANIELLKLKKDLEDERLQMEIEYNERLNNIEPVLVETILKVVNKITHVLSINNKQLVIELVNDVLSKTEISKEFLIKVSPSDYQTVIDNREKINGVVSKKVQIEIIEDPLLSASQCMIESDSGIYDCSLDVQLNNLTNSIKALSCMVED